VGAKITLTTTVSAEGGGPQPSGTVTFYSGSTSLATISLNNGGATLGISSLAVGSHMLTAVYSGDSYYGKTTSNSVTETIDKATPKVTLTSSSNPGKAGNSVKFTVTVAAVSGVAAPTGSVTFYSGNSSLGTKTLSSGTADLSTSSLATGTDFITAVYQGDANYAQTTSNAINEVINNNALTPTGAETDLVLSNQTVNAAAQASQTNAVTKTYKLTLATNGAGKGTVTPNPVGTACGTNCYSYASGKSVTLTAKPATGSLFASWSGACSGSGACKVTMSANLSVSAKFNLAPPPTYILTLSFIGAGKGTVTPSPTGTSCGTNCYSYPAATVVTLAATPTGANSVFAGYSGACSGYFCTLTMSASRSATANFAVLIPTPGKSIYEGTWMGIFSAKYQDCHWNTTTESCNWVTGSQSFTVSVAMTTKLLNFYGYDIMNLTKGNSSDSCFGAQGGFVNLLSGLSSATLPHTPGGKTAGSVSMWFPNGSYLFTYPGTQDPTPLYTSPTGNLMSNSLDPGIQPDDGLTPNVWLAAPNIGFCPDLSPPNGVSREYTQASWSLVKSALTANQAASGRNLKENRP